jgi:U2 small nuclear ribonucleoprotein B''
MPRSTEDGKKKKNKEAVRNAGHGPGQPSLLNNVNVEQPPNQILFLTNLPDETSEMMLSMLFNQYVFYLFYITSLKLTNLFMS